MRLQSILICLAFTLAVPLQTVQADGPYFGSYPQGNSLYQFGQAAAGIQPSLNSLLSRANAYAQNKSFQEGALAAAQHSIPYAEAVKQGFIKSEDNPWFRSGYNEQRLHQLALTYETALRIEYTKGGLQSHSDINSFIGTMRDQALKQAKEEGIKDTQVGKVFIPLLNSAEANLQKHHQTERTEWVNEEAIHKAGSDASKAFTDFLAPNTSLKPFDEATAALIGSKVSEALKQNELSSSGALRDQMNDQIFYAYSARAVEANDPAILDGLKYVKYPDGQNVLTNYPDISLKVAQTKTQIVSDAQTLRLSRQEETAHAREEAINKIMHDFYQGRKLDSVSGKTVPYSGIEAMRDIIIIDPLSPALHRVAVEEAMRHKSRAKLPAQQSVKAGSNHKP